MGEGMNTQEEVHQMLHELLEKVSPHLSDEEMSLLRWATGVDERKKNEVV